MEHLAAFEVSQNPAGATHGTPALMRLSLTAGSTNESRMAAVREDGLDQAGLGGRLARGAVFGSRKGEKVGRWGTVWPRTDTI